MTTCCEYKLGPMTSRRLRLRATLAGLAAVVTCLSPVVAQTVPDAAHDVAPNVVPGVAATLAPDRAANAPSAAAANAPVIALWIEQEFTFTYFGYGTYYSCHGLEDKIEYILKQVGARDDFKVRVNCLEFEGVEWMPTARIRVAVPAEATPELLAKFAADQSRRELVARVQGSGAGVDAATAQFPAERRLVKFEGRRGDPLEDGDCELLEQLLPRVLEPLGVRLAPGSRLRCNPRQSQLGAVDVALETLQKKPEPQVPLPES
jgi:hypothetical protein